MPLNGHFRIMAAAAFKYTRDFSIFLADYRSRGKFKRSAGLEMAIYPRRRFGANSYAGMAGSGDNYCQKAKGAAYKCIFAALL